MSSITAEEIGPETRLPRIDAGGQSSDASVDPIVANAAELVRLAHKRCANLTVDGEGRSSAYVQAVADRREALRILRDTPAANFAGLEMKMDVLAEVEVWIGREDPDCCGFAIQLAHEATALARSCNASVEGGDIPNARGSVGAGRWLIGIAASVPSFFLDRFGTV